MNSGSGKTLFQVDLGSLGNDGVPRLSRFVDRVGERDFTRCLVERTLGDGFMNIICVVRRFPQ